MPSVVQEIFSGLVTSTTNNATLAGTTSVAVAAGDTIILAVGARLGTAGTITVADNSASPLTWVVDEHHTTSGNMDLHLVSAQAPSGLPSGTVITVTWSASHSRKAMIGWEVSGLVSSSAFDVGSNAEGNSSTADPGATAATAQASEIAFMAACHQDDAAGDTCTFASYTALRTGQVGSSGWLGLGLAYKVLSATGTQDESATFSGAAGTWCAVLGTYKATASSLTLTPGAAAAGGAPSAPTVTASGHATLLPNRAAASGAPSGPAVSGAGHATLLPNRAGANTSAYKPTLSGAGTATLLPGAATAGAAADGPTLSPAGYASILAGEASASGAVDGPTIAGAGSATLLPGAAAAGGSAYGATVASPLVLAPGLATAGAAASGPAITASGHATLLPGAAAGIRAADGPTIGGAGHATLPAGEAAAAGSARGATPTIVGGGGGGGLWFDNATYDGCAWGAETGGNLAEQTAGRQLITTHAAPAAFNPAGNSQGNAFDVQAINDLLTGTGTSPFNHPVTPIIHAFGVRSADDTFPSGGLADIAAWTPYVKSMVDAWIVKLRQINGTVLMRVWHEMNDADNVYSYHKHNSSGSAILDNNCSPANFQAAWQTLHDYLAAQGVTNVRWVFCQGGHLASPSAVATAWDPGPAYVDWYATDAYSKQSNGYPSFSNLQDWYDAFKGYGKPMMVAEWGYEADSDPNAATVIGTWVTILKGFPQIKSVTYWFEGINKVTVATTAFKNWAQAPYMNPSLSSGGGGGGGGSGQQTLLAGQAAAARSAYGASLTRPGAQVSTITVNYQPDTIPPSTIHVTQADTTGGGGGGGGGGGLAGTGLHVEAGWTNTTSGVFILGQSRIGSSDVIAGVFQAAAWTDITGEVQAMTIDRGSGDATSQKRQGSLQLTLVDTTGKYNPRNQASPIYGQVDALRPIRAYYVFDNGDGTTTTYPLWYGFVSDVEGPQGKQSPYSSIQAVDLFDRLATLKPVIGSTGQTTTGAAISVVLKAVGWDDRALQSLDAGDAVPDLSADGSNDALSIIGDLIAAEGGTFFISAAGVATYIDHLGSQDVAATITKTNVIRPGLSLDQVATQARITRTDLGGTALGPDQFYADKKALTRYGPRDVPGTPLSTPYVASDQQALELARRLVSLAKDPRAPIWTLTLTRDTDPTLYQLMLSLDVGARITVNDPASSTGGDFTIEGLKHAVSDGGLNHETTWVLRERPTGVFILGQSVIGGPDVLAA